MSNESFYEKSMNQEDVKELRETYIIDDNNEKTKKVYIELQKVFPKDIFGLVQLIYGPISKSTSVALVSEGAECILIKKTFFKRFMNDKLHRALSKAVNLKKKLRK
jgi:hypothetical protein